MTKQEQMFSLMEEYEQSKQTIPAFCKERSMKVPTFNYWRKKFRDSRSASKGFIPILPPPEHSKTDTIRLAYPNGVNIHLPAANIVLIAQLIRLA